MKKNNGIILFVIVLMSFVACLDMSIVNIALPVMAKSLSVSMSIIELVVLSYITIICSIIMVFGKLGDLVGKVTIFKIGIIIFTAASFMCGMVNNIIFLIVARMIQAIGAAAFMANNQGIITEIFDQKERGKALGVLASMVALGTMLGPAVGGVILGSLNWNYIFWVNVPIGIAALILDMKFLPKDNKTKGKLDITGAITFFIFSTSLICTLIGEQNLGLFNSLIVGGLILTLLSFAIFIRVQKVKANPLLNLDIFKNKLFSVSLLCAFISFVCISASGIIVPFYLQYTLKINTYESGLILMISPLVITLISPISGAISDKIGANSITVLGLLFTGLGFLLMSFWDCNSSVFIVITFQIVMAIGNGFFQPSNNYLIMSAAPKNKLGIAGSVNSLVRNFGQVIGVTFGTTILYSLMSYKIGYHITTYLSERDDIFVFGMKGVYIILALLCLVGALVTINRAIKKDSYETINEL